jgi:AcrR family transcriptional regulator
VTENRLPARDRLLAAARTVLAREGVEGLTLRAIAREAGVSHGAPLRHFPTLGRLLAALSAEGFQQLMASVAAAVGEPELGDDDRHDGDGHDDDSGQRGARHRLARAGRGYLRFAVAEPGVYSVMFRPELADIDDPGYQAASAASFDQLVELVAAAQATGWQADRPTNRLAAVLWANVHGLAELWLHGALQAVVEVENVGELADDLFGLSLLDLDPPSAVSRRRRRAGGAGG